MAEDEKFLARWSRLKREAEDAAAHPPAAAAPAAPAELPPVDSLGFDSDFTAFLQDKVDEKLKQAALRKLFHSPEFNRMDGLDVYIDDYNKFEPIPEAMLRELNHAQDLLFGESEAERRADAESAPERPTQAPDQPAPSAPAEPAMPPAQDTASETPDDPDNRS